MCILIDSQIENSFVLDYVLELDIIALAIRDIVEIAKGDAKSSGGNKSVDLFPDGGILLTRAIEFLRVSLSLVFMFGCTTSSLPTRYSIELDSGT